jgi:hypothetical protein
MVSKFLNCFSPRNVYEKKIIIVIMYTKKNLLALPNPKSRRVLSVNLRCSVQMLPWLRITPVRGPKTNISKISNQFFCLKTIVASDPLRHGHSK